MTIRNRIIYGPPGTGKTTTLLGCMRDHVKHPGRRTLFCSHTRAAAQEALSRWPVEQIAAVDIQTLHSFCFKQLKFSQAQTVDAPKLKDFGEEFGIDMMEEDSLGRGYLDVLNLSQALCVSPEAGYERSWRPGSPAHYKAMVDSYLQWKSQFGYVDFNDMLTMALDRMHAIPTYTQIVIDEAQDLTPLQWKVARRIRDLLPRAEVIVAGDDDQCLFAWSGAHPAGMTQFGDEMAADKHVLSQSYRVPKAVHALAQKIIVKVRDRVEKKYLPRDFPGLVTRFPDSGPLHEFLSHTRDSMVIHSDKFVRREIEPILKENGYVYNNINGTASPLNTRAGKALQVAARFGYSDIEASDELLSALKSGLNAYGQQVWDHVGAHTVYDRIRRRDLQVLSAYNSHFEYFQTVDLTKDPNIRVSSMHGAKGLEAADVHLFLTLSSAAWSHAAEHPEHLDRLIYTAVTRAREKLFIYDGPDAYELPT